MRVLQLCLRQDDSLAHLTELTIQALALEGHDVFSGYLEEPCFQKVNGSAQLFGFGYSDKMLKRHRGHIARELAAFCRAHRIDAIITHRFKPCDIAVRMSRYYNFQQKIGIFHGRGEFRRPLRKIRLRQQLKKSWKLVAVSKAVRDDLLAAWQGFSPEQVTVIPNAIDFHTVTAEQLSREDARNALNIPQDVFVIGSIGRLVPKKGFPYLIEAIAGIQSPCMLVIIGEGRDRETLERLINETGIDHRVKLTGALSKAFRYVKAFDLFVLPSLEEAFGLVLLEAIAADIPVIGSTAGGIPEVLGENALLAEAGSAPALKKAITQFYAFTPMEQQAYREAIKNRAIHLYDSPVYCQSFNNLLK